MQPEEALLVLGCTQNARPSNIRKRFRYLVKRVHPDIAARSSAQFYEVVEAYRVLQERERSTRVHASYVRTTPRPRGDNASVADYEERGDRRLRLARRVYECGRALESAESVEQRLAAAGELARLDTPLARRYLCRALTDADTRVFAFALHRLVVARQPGLDAELAAIYARITPGRRARVRAAVSDRRSQFVKLWRAMEVDT